MASRTIVDTDLTNTYELDLSDHVWVFTEGRLVNGEDSSIHQASTSSNDTVIVNGFVFSNATNGSGIFFEGSNSKIVINETGSVSGTVGIDAEGSDMTVTNNGIVTSRGFAPAIYAAGANAHVVNNGDLYGVTGIDVNSSTGHVENNGVIRAYYTGISIDTGGATVELGKNSEITATLQGVSVSSATGETTTTINDGLIAMSGMTAFGGSDGDEIVINKGTIRGDVYLGAGDDLFTNRGRFAGFVSGESGDDTYVVDSARIHISENSGQGTDTVRSSVSLSFLSGLLVSSELENLTLVGSKNINGTGNDQQNTIGGNGADNILSGGGQDDLLIGGQGRDTFVFSTNFDSDTISDFRAGIDSIDLSGVVDIANFSDMMKNHVSVIAGDVRISSGADVLILDDVSKSDLHATDFIF